MSLKYEPASEPIPGRNAFEAQCLQVVSLTSSTVYKSCLSSVCKSCFSRQVLNLFLSLCRSLALALYLALYQRVLSLTEAASGSRRLLVKMLSVK